MILDERFERFLEEYLGFQAFEILPSNSRSEALRFWRDNIKPGFTGIDSEGENDDVGWLLPLPGSRDDPLKGLEGGFLELSAYVVNQRALPYLLLTSFFFSFPDGKSKGCLIQSCKTY
jgi:hypothetical protein